MMESMQKVPKELAVKIGRRAVKCIAFSIVFLLLLQGASMVLVPRNDKAEDSTLNTVVFGYLGPAAPESFDCMAARQGGARPPISPRPGAGSGCDVPQPQHAQKPLEDVCG